MVERMAILELRAVRGWSKTETGRRFFVSDDTIRAWLRRVDDDSRGEVVQRLSPALPWAGKPPRKLAIAGIIAELPQRHHELSRPSCQPCRGA